MKPAIKLDSLKIAFLLPTSLKITQISINSAILTHNRATYQKRCHQRKFKVF